jgi:sodium transport system permease protein
MRWSIVRTIFGKELVETLRDRRALFAMFALPVLLHPLLFLALGRVTAAETQKRKTIAPRVALFGPMPRALEDRLAAEIGLTIAARLPAPAAPADAAAEARRLLDARTVDLALLVPADAEARLAADDGVGLTALYSSVNDASRGAHARLAKALDKISSEELAARRARRKLPDGFADPYRLVDEDLASSRMRGAEIAGRALPVIVLFVIVTCGLLPAIDLTAGEKERGTLQTLLCAPVRPLELVAGKYLTVVVASLIGAAANLLAMGFALSRQVAALGDDLELGMSLSTGLVLFVAIVPAALLLSALLLGLGVFARSFREAQSYLTPLLLVVLMPAMATLVPGVELSPSTALVPIANLALLIRGVVAGTAPAQLVFVVIVANLAYAAAALVFTARVFETEQVLLSGESPWRDVFGRAARARVTPTPRSAILFSVVLLVVAYYGSIFADPQRVGLLGMLLVVQLGLFLAPAIVWALASRVSLRETFSLRLPSARGAAGIFCLTLGGWAVGEVVARSLLPLFPGARAYAEELARLLGPGDAKIAVAVALLPAVAEEACFRGVVLAGLANSGRRAVAIVGSALAFGLLHLQPFHVLTASVTGVVLGWATLETGSLLAGALIHAANNGLRMVALHHPAVEKALAHPGVIAAGLALTALGLALVRRRRAERRRAIAS